MRHRKYIAFAGLLVFSVLMGFSIQQKEHILAGGQEIYLTIEPRDPRSLMQGDYMQLAYDRATLFPADLASNISDIPYRGKVILSLDEKRVAHWKGFASEVQQEVGDINIIYRKTGNRNIRYTALSYLFQEGRAKHFEKARYIIVRVDSKGNSLITGLADEAFQKL